MASINKHDWEKNLSGGLQLCCLHLLHDDGGVLILTKCKGSLIFSTKIFSVFVYKSIKD